MTLVDSVRLVGTAVAVAGTLITTRAGFGELLGMARRLGASAVRALTPWRVPPQSVNITGVAALAEVAAIAEGIVVTVHPSPDSTVGERLAGLWDRLEHAQREAAELRGHVDKGAREIESRIAAVEQSARAAVEQLRDDLANVERHETRINAFGLPVIMLGVVLTGLPDGWVANPWVAAILIAVSVVATGQGTRLAYREHRRGLS